MNYGEYYMINYGLPILGLIITSIAQFFVTSSYSKYRQEKTETNQKGCNIARKILDKNGLNDVEVIKISGSLSDNYDPKKKVVSLSNDIYEGTSIASVSVAAHECGHAIQDKVGYTPMKIRASLVPVINISTKIGYVVIMIGIFFGVINLAVIGLILILGILIFQLITLPVEFNASLRARKELEELHILTETEKKGSSSMLKAAAFTYVAGVLTAFLQVLRQALIVFSRRDD